MTLRSRNVAVPFSPVRFSASVWRPCFAISGNPGSGPSLSVTVTLYSGISELASAEVSVAV